MKCAQRRAAEGREVCADCYEAPLLAGSHLAIQAATRLRKCRNRAAGLSSFPRWALHEIGVAYDALRRAAADLAEMEGSDGEV